MHLFNINHCLHSLFITWVVRQRSEDTEICIYMAKKMKMIVFERHRLNGPESAAFAAVCTPAC